NRLCVSGMQAAHAAAHAIACGLGDVYTAGGVESMTRAPYVLASPQEAFPRGPMVLQDTTIGWRFPNPKLAEVYPLYSMGETAENVAERYGISRDDQDVLAWESQQRASAAQREGRFAEELVPVAVAGVDPSYMGIGPVPASRKALVRAGRRIDEMDLIELNEAFAVQVLACVRDLDIDRARLNPNGGAIALGHPIGASGARILATLAHEMRRRQARWGLATMCIGVGQGIATVVE